MTNKSNILHSNLVDFPEEIDVHSGVRIYGEASYENQMAVLSHFLHSEEKDKKEKTEIINSANGLRKNTFQSNSTFFALVFHAKRFHYQENGC